MHHQDTDRLRGRKTKIDERLDPRWQPETACPVIGGTNLTYEVSGRVDAIPCGGIGVIHEVVRALGLQEDIDGIVHLFKRHRPYHESDHVLNLAYNITRSSSDGERLTSNETRRTAAQMRSCPPQTLHESEGRSTGW